MKLLLPWRDEENEAEQARRAMLEQMFAERFPALSRLGVVSTTDIWDLLEALAWELEQKQGR